MTEVESLLHGRLRRYSPPKLLSTGAINNGGMLPVGPALTSLCLLYYHIHEAYLALAAPTGVFSDPNLSVLDSDESPACSFFSGIEPFVSREGQQYLQNIVTHDLHSSCSPRLRKI